ncbi:L-threonylcarbamoyladenylate synthase [Treponema pedis]|uniref:L-threonylcarbamoyladenylate synthase n=1 Tax=Treponema pedis TaxID=409322 RepID=UPI0019826AE9|nr:L-threonylcarbamoyladenylate synthase [Treponema pedis]QSI05081.1 Sua5/YciO/YrdC/YwlC family protein [Treponema pedis]
MLIQKDGADSADIAASFLKSGKVIIIPTDTIYGFSGIVPYTKREIFKIKRRPPSKELITLIAEPEDIFNYTSSSVPKELFGLWPAPLTLIVKDTENGGTSAFRCPDDDWLRSVIKKTGAPIYSTSVNYSAFPALTKIEDIKKEFEDIIPLIVDGGKVYNDKICAASTIISLVGEKPAVIREGAVETDFLFNTKY